AQTPLFDKSAILYGLHKAVDAMKQQHTAVLVEGYMDVLMAHQYGFRNVVASMGTALSDRQVATLKRLANTFILALDPDAAGDEATLRSLESSWKILDQPVRVMGQALLTGPDTSHDLTLKVMDLPRGVDPDEVIRGEPAKWTELLQSATPVIDYVFSSLAKRSDLTTPRGKASLTQRLAPFILQTSNVYEQNQRIRKLATLLNEDEDVVRFAVIGPRPASSRSRPAKQRTLESALAKPVRDTLEAYCMAMLLRYPELAPVASTLTVEHFSTASLQEMHALLSSGVPSEDLRQRLPEGLEDELDWLLGYALPPATFKEREHGLAECVRRLEERRLKLQSQALQARVGEDMESPGLHTFAEDLRERLLRNYEKSG
ncbi:MAG: primase, partial [Dehalococcoidia bacterium]|nr:primase [Dehalococcoidia bacterium]